MLFHSKILSIIITFRRGSSSVIENMVPLVN